MLPLAMETIKHPDPKEEAAKKYLDRKISWLEVLLILGLPEPVLSNPPTPRKVSPKPKS